MVVRCAGGCWASWLDGGGGGGGVMIAFPVGSNGALAVYCAFVSGIGGVWCGSAMGGSSGLG